MNNLAHPPIQQARAKLRVMSADEEARYWAEAREKALRDEATLIGDAHDQGVEQGRKEGRQEGRDEGRQEERNKTALAMLQGGQLDVATIARYTDLSETEVQELADGRAKH
ncbi:hypothetical protein [Thiorhodovibrio winogradskyi]|uniref:hypothetical protein n=1 Tax=Thiorhodovibrio winogradskyi TaxID=77007 RepID=UPI002E28D9B0|nr:hypothetical protein [Thiorhodovibrio winogradskyi]